MLRVAWVAYIYAEKQFIMSNIHEIWKDIIGYEGLYQISNSGKVKSLLRKAKNSRGSDKVYPEKLLKLKTNNDGYFAVTLIKNHVKKTINIHRLVACAFIDNLQNKKTVNHINGVKTDNNVNNLEWATVYENIQHAIKHGLRKAPKGEKHGNSKLTDEEAEYIRNNYIKYNNCNKLADMFGVTRGCIAGIAAGRKRNKLNYKTL